MKNRKTKNRALFKRTNSPLVDLEDLKKLLLFLLLVFFGCKETQKPLESIFLENVMIREGGLYVLMGSKPMCTFPVDSGYPETQEECREHYQVYLKTLKMNSTKKPVKYETFVHEHLSSLHMHHKTLWKAWQDKMGEIVGPNYCFITKSSPFGQKRIQGLFLNKTNTLYILNEYYDDFKKIVGFDFSPEEVLKQISLEKSPFWDKIFSNNYLQGLLFGYGKRNSFIFSWTMEQGISLPVSSICISNESLSDKIAVSDLPLPSITVSSFGDKTLSKYKRERTEIIKALKGKSFEKTVKNWLEGKLSMQDPLIQRD